MTRSGVLGVVAALSAVGVLFAPAASRAADAAHGRTLFQTCCSLCHAGAPGDGEGGMGPPLAGVVGRKAASAPGFGYSPALRKSGLAWTKANLERFLKAPSAMVPGTTMPIATPSQADRADIIAYLAALKP